MSQSERVVLTRDYEHPVHGEQRVFRAGVHTLPAEIASAARLDGAAEPAASKPALKPAAKRAKAKR